MGYFQLIQRWAHSKFGYGLSSRGHDLLRLDIEPRLNDIIFILYFSGSLSATAEIQITLGSKQSLVCKKTLNHGVKVRKLMFELLSIHASFQGFNWQHFHGHNNKIDLTFFINNTIRFQSWIIYFLSSESFLFYWFSQSIC